MTDIYAKAMRELRKETGFVAPKRKPLTPGSIAVRKKRLKLRYDGRYEIALAHYELSVKLMREIMEELNMTRTNTEAMVPEGLVDWLSERADNLAHEPEAEYADHRAHDAGREDECRYILAHVRTTLAARPSPPKVERLLEENAALRKRGAEAIIAYHVAICSPKGVVPNESFYDPFIAARCQAEIDAARATRSFPTINTNHRP